MTNNPTIDGVLIPRELLSAYIERAKGYDDATLRSGLLAILDADIPASVAPAVERQERTAHSMKSVAEAVDASRCYTVLTSNQCYALAQSLNNQAVRVSAAENTDLQSTIAQLQARIAELESGRGEPVAYADPIAFENFKNYAHKGGHWDHEWMWAKPDSRMVALYTAPPAQVAVMPDGWKLVPVELTSRMLEAGKDERMDCFTNPSLSVQGALIRIYSAIIEAAPSCLDATAALNGVPK